MSDGCPSGCSGKAPVGNQRHISVNSLIAADRLGGRNHLRHAAAAGAFVTDNDDLSRVDLFPHHCVIGILLAVEYPRLRIDHLPLVLRTGGIFDHRALRRNVSLQDGNRALFFYLFDRKNNLLPLKTIIVQISKIPLKPVVLPELLQIFSERLSRHSQDIQIQIIAQHPLHHGNTARKPEALCQLRSGRIHISDVRNPVIDLIEQLNRKLHTGLPCNGGQMERCVGGAADCGMHHDCISEGTGCQDLVGRQIFLRKLHDLSSCLSGILEKIPHRRRHKCRSRKGQAQSFRKALHRGGCPKE